MATFLDRNKKKSALAALLLFLRERKILVLLLLLVLVASTVFLSPSSWLTGLPGGSRLAASVAWVAGKMGVDVSKWGLGPGGRQSFNDLEAAFAAARMGNGSVGWGAFFGRPGAGGGAGAGSPNSVDMVKGSASDLDAGSGKGTNGGKNANGSGADTVAAVINPGDAKADKDGGAVALSNADVGGQREGFVKSAFAGGFMNGLLGGDGLSGGAFASKGFFAGSGGATSVGTGDLAQNALSRIGTPSVPTSKIQGAAKGRLSAMSSLGVETRGMTGAAKAGSSAGNSAFGQLASGSGRARLASPYAQQTGDTFCPAPGCPNEFAAANTGAIYDGNAVQNSPDTSVLSAPEVDGTTPPNIPDTGIATDYENQANQMTNNATACQAADTQYSGQESTLNAQMQAISQKFQSAGCGSGGCSQSKANYCQGLGNQLKSTCQSYMTVECQQQQACPLTAVAGVTCPDPSSQAECNTGDGVHATPVTVVAGSGQVLTGDAATTAATTNAPAQTISSSRSNATGTGTTGNNEDNSDIGATTVHTSGDCPAVDAQYTPQEEPVASEMIADSTNWYSNKCDQPLSPLDPNWKKHQQYCSSQNSDYLRACSNYNTLRCQHMSACPATAGQSCGSTCNITKQTPAQLQTLYNAMYPAP